MSTTPDTSIPPTPPPAPSAPPPRKRELVIVGHSNLFYWWPVWATGFILSVLTWFHDTHMALVPAHTTIAKIPTKEMKKELPEEVTKELKGESVPVLFSTKGADFPRSKGTNDEMVYKTPYMHTSRGLGVVFMIVLLVVITITNIPMRGLWSVVVLMLVLLGAVIFAQAGWWDTIFSNFRLLAIHVNLGGYLFFSIVLFGIWLINFLFFDHQIYMIFTPGQVRVRVEIGGGETAYETTGMVFQKQRSDLFRHWILGFGSGDLVIRPAQTREPIEMHNVLNVGRRVREIERLLKEREVVATAS
jgi:hypothetical protein